MAEVWLGSDAAGGRAAVKWLRAEAVHHRARFLDEAQVAAGLSHPNIVAFFGQGESLGRPWYAMEYVAGPDLAALGEKLRARPVAERHARAREAAVQLAGALGHLHEKGLVHRDVKPANVLWAGRAVLADFGVVCPFGSQAEAGFVGSLAWAAPEQVLGGDVDARADQFGLGLVLYWLLTGSRPWGESGRLRSASVRPPPPSTIDPTVPPDLEAVILRLIAVQPADRFRDMLAVENAVKAVGESDAPILAGRQVYADRIANELDRVVGGETRVVRLSGAPGSGQEWLSRLSVSGAARRGVQCVATDDLMELSRARARGESGEALLIVTQAAVAADTVVELRPLGLGDIRRTVFSVAPRTLQLAVVSERLFALTGGHAALVEAVLQAGVRGGELVVDPAPAVDVSGFLDPLDLDSLELAQAVAALPEPARPEVLSAVVGREVGSAGTKDEGLAALERGGLVECVAGRWRLVAELFRTPLLDRAPDLEALRARANAAGTPALEEDSVLAAARVAIAAGKHQEAVQALIAAVDVETAPGTVRAERSLLLATLHWYLKDAEGASKLWNTVQTEAADARHRARASVGLGVIALQAGEIERALDHLVSAHVDADIVHDARTLALANLDLAEARVLHGEPARALRAARRARDEARALREPALEAKACRALGQVLVDLGMASEAEAVLVDSTALARASGAEEERMAAQVLRARALLDSRPGDATAAAVALDRLVPWSRAVGAAADPESIRPLVQAMLARAYAAMGQVSQSAAAAELALQLGALAPRAMRLRAGIEVVRAWTALGRTAEALALARSVGTEAERGTMRLLAWEAGCLAARLGGGQMPDLGAMVSGLSEAERTALIGRFGAT